MQDDRAHRLAQDALSPVRGMKDETDFFVAEVSSVADVLASQFDLEVDLALFPSRNATVE